MLPAATATIEFVLAKALSLPLRAHEREPIHAVQLPAGIALERGDRTSNGDLSALLAGTLDADAVKGTLAVWQRHGQAALILRKTGNLVAAAVFRPHPLLAAASIQPFLYYIVVAEAARGTGLGEILLKASMQSFRHGGYRAMGLMAQNDSGAARLYRRLGFTAYAPVPWRRDNSLFRVSLQD